MGRRSKSSMEQISARPESGIKFIQEAVHSLKATLDELFNLGIIGKRYIIIQSNECEYKAVEHVRCWIDSYLFEEDTIAAYRRTDTTIKNISFKGADSTTRYLNK